MATSLDPQVSPALSGAVVVPAEFLDRIVDRLERMERQLDRLAQPLEQAPHLAAAAADTADGWARDAMARGVDIDASLAAAGKVAERLAAPDTLARVERLMERLDTVEDAVAMAATLPGTLAMAGDIIDGWIKRAQADGVDLDATLQAVVPALKTLADPAVVRALDTLTRQLPEVARLVEDGPKLVATTVDSIDGLIGRLTARGIDIQALGESVAVAVAKFAELLNSSQYKALMNSGVLDPKTLEMVGKAGSALVHARMDACQETSVFGALRATGDRDVQRAIGFAIKFAHTFGQELAQADNLKHLAASNGTMQAP